MVPFGPKLVRMVSWRPFAAEIFMANACEARANSAFGFSKLIEAIFDAIQTLISSSKCFLWFQTRNPASQSSEFNKCRNICKNLLTNRELFCRLPVGKWESETISNFLLAKKEQASEWAGERKANGIDSFLVESERDRRFYSLVLNFHALISDSTLQLTPAPTLSRLFMDANSKKETLRNNCLWIGFLMSWRIIHCIYCRTCINGNG